MRSRFSDPATQPDVNAPLLWWRTQLSAGLRRSLAKLWPWSLVAAVISWLLLMPGTMLLDFFLGVSNPVLVVPVIALTAFGLLLLTIFAGFAYDVQQRTGLRQE